MGRLIQEDGVFYTFNTKDDSSLKEFFYISFNVPKGIVILEKIFVLGDEKNFFKLLLKWNHVVSYFRKHFQIY